jgi:hypothetical protein
VLGAEWQCINSSARANVFLQLLSGEQTYREIVEVIIRALVSSAKRQNERAARRIVRGLDPSRFAGAKVCHNMTASLVTRRKGKVPHEEVNIFAT